MNHTHRWPMAMAALLPALLACPTTTPAPELPRPPVVESFTASATQVAQPGERVTLSWKVVDASSVSITRQDGTPVELADPTAQQGSVETEVERSTGYLLTARGAGGSDTSATSVLLAQTSKDMIFTVLPEEVRAQEPATLVWNAPFAAQLSITDGSGTELYAGDRTQGSLTWAPPFSTTLVLTADGETAETTVTVEPVIAVFTATPETALAGDKVTLKWSAPGASSVRLFAEGRGELARGETPAEIIDGAFEDTVPANLGANGLVHYTLEALGGEQVVRQELDVWVGTQTVIESFVVPEFAREGGSFFVSWKAVNAESLELEADGTVIYQAPTQGEVDQKTLLLPSPVAGTTQKMRLRVRNGRGGVATQEASVAAVGMPQVVDFSADVTTVAQGGEPVTLSWNVPNARDLTIKEKRTGRLLVRSQGTAAETGSFSHYPNRLTDYVLEANNTVGDSVAPQEVSVGVAAPAVLVFDPPSAPLGATVQVTGSTAVGSGDIHRLPVWEQNLAGEQFEDISQTGVNISWAYSGDTNPLAQALPLGELFSTRVFGVPVSSNRFIVSVNGWMKFNNATIVGPDTPSAFPTAALEPLAIAPYWADLYFVKETSKLFYRLDWDGLERRLIVQWDKFFHDAGNSPATGTELTFQAQISSNGKIVFAYKTLQGSGAPAVSIGAVSADEQAAVAPNVTPVAGDTFTLFGKATPPKPMKVASVPYTVEVEVAGGAGLLELTSSYPVMEPNRFYISEANYNPVTGRGEWFEVTNTTAQPVDLAGWTIDFGGGNTHPIPGPLVLPANGRLLFGQDPDAAELSAGGHAIDYVYGTGFSMTEPAGSIKLSYYGGVYCSLSWTTAGTQGTALQNDPPRGQIVGSAAFSTACPATAVYGASGQKGTPGSSNGPFCVPVPWVLSSISGAFQSIATTGAVIAPFLSTAANSLDAVYGTLNFTGTGGRAVTLDGVTYGNLLNPFRVDSNGFLYAGAIGTNTNTNATAPATTAPNFVIAPFWEDLAGNDPATGPSGVFWQQFDPDGTPASGDEYTLISWENWKHRYIATGSSLNFQVKILEGTGDLEFHYGTMTLPSATYDLGVGATVWLETVDGKYALAASINQARVFPNSGFRFTHLSP